MNCRHDHAIYALRRYDAAMGRRVSTMLVVVSLLICIATTIIWRRSSLATEDFEYARYVQPDGERLAYVRYGVYPHDDSLDFVHSVMLRRANDGIPTGLQHHRRLYVNESYYEHIIKPRNSVAGIAWGRVHDRNSSTDFFGQGIRVPFWLLMAISIILPARFTFLRLRRRVRRKKSCCTSCGYDLRATPHQCPECGTIPVKQDQIST